MTVITSPDGTTVAPFTDGYTYNLQSSLSVRADPLSGVASVVFQLDGRRIQTEDNAPYDVAGDIGTSATRWTPSAGNHTLMSPPPCCRCLPPGPSRPRAQVLAGSFENASCSRFQTSIFPCKIPSHARMPHEPLMPHLCCLCCAPLQVHGASPSFLFFDHALPNLLKLTLLFLTDHHDIARGVNAYTLRLVSILAWH